MLILLANPFCVLFSGDVVPLLFLASFFVRKQTVKSVWVPQPAIIWTFMRSDREGQRAAAAQATAADPEDAASRPDSVIV